MTFQMLKLNLTQSTVTYNIVCLVKKILRAKEINMYNNEKNLVTSLLGANFDHEVV
jgi:hypothetical protein